MAITLDDIAQVLSAHDAPLLPPGGSIRAAVAMVFRRNGNVPELLFIERAQHPGDPWSGNIGFPGGKVEEEDRSPRGTAEREAWEELSLDLSAARFLGFLGEVAGAHLPVRVSCFVYHLDVPALLSPNDEVVDAFWVGLPDLSPPEHHCTIPIPFGGETSLRPAIRLPQPGKPFLWGLTYRLVMELFNLLDSRSATPRSTLPTPAP